MIILKVCIIGAGVSGLSCALTLEKYGIIPDIYDQFDYCGGRVPFVVCLLQIMHRPIKDPLISLAKDYNINLAPIGSLNRIIRFSPHNISKTTGQLGYIFELGATGNSITSQLFGRLNTGINFGVTADFKELSRNYDKVVVSTGTSYVAKALGFWRDTFRGWVRGAVIRGNFASDTWLIWLNKSYCNKGYAYLGPFSSQKATLVLAVSDIKENQLESHWKMFLETEKLEYQEEDRFVQEHIAGFCRPAEKNNIILAGNSGGLMEPVFGFGLYHAVVSGVMAARSIAEQIPYESSLSFIRKKLYQSYVLRQRLNSFQNNDYDQMMGLFNIPPINRLIYNTNLDVLKHHKDFSSIFPPGASQ